MNASSASSPERAPLSGLQRELAAAAGPGPERGRVKSLAGLVPTAKTFLCSGLFPAWKRTLLVLARGQKEAEKWAADLAAFLPGTSVDFYPAVYYYAGIESAELAAWCDKIRTLDRLASGQRTLVVAPVEALFQPVISPSDLREAALVLSKGAQMKFDDVPVLLDMAGYAPVEAVSAPGQFSIRGCIVDVFSAGDPHPVRATFFGDEVESVRVFDRGTQKSVRVLDGPVRVRPMLPERRENALWDYLPADTVVVLDEPDEIRARLDDHTWEKSRPASEVEQAVGALARLELFTLPRAGALEIRSAPPGGLITRETAYAQLKAWRGEGMRVLISCNNEGERDRLGELLRQNGVEPDGVWILGVDTGFQLPDFRLAFVTDQDIFGRYKVRKKTVHQAWAGAEKPQAFDIEKGDYVVHLIHGIGRFLGFQKGREAGDTQEYLVIEYREKARLYVPTSHIYLVDRYRGVGTAPRELDKLGTNHWKAKKERVQHLLMDVAAEMLEVQARREMTPGFAFPPDTEWQMEFEKAFLYEDTDDQHRASTQIKADMERARPMDRLLCGDVGFGKTEVAVRAAFKAVMGRRQVAVLVPTTILAYQHFRTFSERMADYPVRVEMLSRFRTAREQEKILLDLVEGKVDILIGTHRLIQDDVRFKDLGLLIIDEEQRFGVKHKEKFKKMRALVDILTITATPIPRTLYMALVGLREMSTIMTPPKDRVPVKTVVIPDEDDRLREVIEFELRRDGQVFFLHNRVHDIGAVRDRLAGLVPQARIAVGHGQMPEGELEVVVRDFVDGRIDVLLCTTIIESGVDIPNANTIVIDEAWHFGLAELYQLRGRVGRYKEQAFAYLVVPEGQSIPDDARERMQAIRQFDFLGAGYKIALKDLEIRGAGNILGEEQSGHIAEIGFDLYCKLLRENVQRIKGEPVPLSGEVYFYLGFDPLLPEAYIPSAMDRLDFYRRIGSSLTHGQIDEVSEELFDRFGPLHPDAAVFLNLARAKIVARERGVKIVEIQGGRFIAKGEGTILGIGDVEPAMLQNRNRMAAGLLAALKGIPGGAAPQA